MDNLTKEQRDIAENNINLAYKFCNDHLLYNMEGEDYRQCMLLEMCESLLHYNGDKSKPTTFLNKCFKNEYANIIRGLNQQCRTLPEDYKILYLDALETDFTQCQYCSQQEDISYKLLIQSIKKKVNKKYGKMYAEIFEMKANDVTLKEIGKKFGMSRQAISVKLEKMKPLIKEELKNCV